MNKYRFENGYVAEWRNRAINPDSVNTLKIEWTPNPPDFMELGNQFLGEYLYKFAPSLCQPIADRMKQPFPHQIVAGPMVVVILFEPNGRPLYYANGVQQLIVPSTPLETLTKKLSKN
jgi:hypothetical protein